MRCVKDTINEVPGVRLHVYTWHIELTLESVYLLLFIATLVAIATQRVRIPYTIGLVIAGIAVSFLPFIPAIELSKELIFTVLLPPLIFEATLFIRWRELMRNLPVILHPTRSWQ